MPFCHYDQGMPTIDQSRVTSGYDVEAMIGAGYLRIILQTAVDAGLIPSSQVLGGRLVKLEVMGDHSRLYEPTPDAEGNFPPSSTEAFETEIFFEHPQGFDLRVRLRVQPEGFFGVFVDLFIQVGMTRTPDGDGGLESASFVIHVADIESPILATLAEPPFNITKAEILAKLQEEVDRQIDLGSASAFKRIEDIAFRFLPGDADHDPALGLYINLRLRNGDHDDEFVAPRGETLAGQNFLPAGSEIAFASRPGLYQDLGKDVFSRTALENAVGGIEHVLRRNLLNLNSERIGDVHSISVGQLTKPATASSSAPPIPVNGMRLTLRGEYEDPIELTRTDFTFTLSVVPRIDADGLLDWDSDVNVSVDLLFDFKTLWAATLGLILFGPIGAGVILGVAIVGQVGLGIYLGERFESRAQKKTDATLADVIPDRLTIRTARWDPFYATKHQVVIKPTQAEFNSVGFMLCGTAIVGRQLVPPQDTVIRDEVRADGEPDGEIVGLRYLIADADKVAADALIQPPGAHRRPHTPPDPAEPDLFTLTLDDIQSRAAEKDEQGNDQPLILMRIPYFPVCAYIRDNQINQLLCLSGPELEATRDRLRSQVADGIFADIDADRGDEIRQEVLDDLTAASEPDDPPTDQELLDEFNRRVNALVKKEMSDYESPTPLEMAHSGFLHDQLRFDAAPEELLMLQDRKIIVIDTALTSIKPREMARHLRDIPRSGEEEEHDNLLERPRYRPGPNGPQFD